MGTMPPQTESSRTTGDRQLQSVPYAGEHSCAYTCEWVRLGLGGWSQHPWGQAQRKHSLPPRGPTGLAERSRGRRTELAQKLETGVGKQSPVTPTLCPPRTLEPSRHRADQSQAQRSPEG